MRSRAAWSLGETRAKYRPRRTKCTPHPLTVGFIDQVRAKAVESIIRVLREQGVQVTARTYRAWKQGRVAARTVSDALVVDAAWTDVTNPITGEVRRKMTPEGRDGRSTPEPAARAAWPGL